MTMWGLKFREIGPERGRHGSPRADTLGKQSHGLQEGFWMPPGPLGGHTKKQKKHAKHMQKS